MPISSYVVRYQHQDKEAVLEGLASIPGVSIGSAENDGVPVVLETESSKDASLIGERLGAVQGVIDAVLVYHNFEDIEDAGPMPPKRPRQSTPLNRNLS